GTGVASSLNHQPISRSQCRDGGAARERRPSALGTSEVRWMCAGHPMGCPSVRLLCGAVGSVLMCRRFLRPLAGEEERAPVKPHGQLVRLGSRLTPLAPAAYRRGNLPRPFRLLTQRECSSWGGFPT